MTQHEVSFINTNEATKKVERPKRKRQKYKYREPQESCRLFNPILHHCGGSDEKIPPAPGTNQIAEFVEFRLLMNWKTGNKPYL